MLDLPILSQPAVDIQTAPSNGLRVHVESYGCQMNTNDSEIVMGVMHANGYASATGPDDADVILLNTCAIRDNAEKKIHERLMHLKHYKKSNRDLVVGVLGCMAERLRVKLLDTKLVDLVVGPDEYRRVPELVDSAMGGERGIAVKLSRFETYDDIVPLRTDGVSAWTSIMRGCDKFCTFCVVPFTRGRERSRPLQSIVDETKGLWDSGFKEINLLGQNVNSYRDEVSGYDFSDLLAATARALPSMRIRYSTSHPQDMSDKLIDTMAEYDNICKHVHLPVQSGSNRILELMNRTYSVEHYIGRLERIKKAMPNCATTTDIITGFCTETEDDHLQTLELIRRIRYEGAYMFTYSPRENTKAWKMGDDVPDDVKSRRLTEIIEVQSEIARQINTREEGVTHDVLIDGPSKRDATHWKGRTDTNKIVVFTPLDATPCAVGDTVRVKIERTNKATLVGHMLAH
ncbi:MAG: tRNA (N6-isopentenyl adenosine(37)-C2)-methylthiotransferase MiaB [Candidatus Kapabacteria bacterium]|nr:tRNA (N6-isopentenyl adenosine(37)-C2)-methylthiotransferase MiaB [Candidatus Kapabacteria bacterium]